jgi:putative ABC transport system permease protein
VFRLVISSGTKTVALGAATGLVLSVAAGTWLRGLLIGVQPLDPLTYVGVTTILVAVALAACALPARRAASVDPAITLRDD